MKTTNRKTNRTNAFTLIEMIGVLAVIAILAALLIPKVFQAITEAKINTVPVGAATCKTGTVDHYAKWGALNVIGVPDTSVTPNTPTTPITSLPHVDYDTTVLMREGFLDKPFAPRVGTAADVQLVACVANTVTVDGATSGAYNLDGVGTVNDVLGSHVVEAVIQGVPIADAQAISARIDGAALSQAEGATTADIVGRVMYAAGATTTVYIYLTHR